MFHLRFFTSLKIGVAEDKEEEKEDASQNENI